MTWREPARPSAIPTSFPSLPEAIAHGSQEAIFVLDPHHDFRIVFANEAACRHLGRTPEELLTMSPVDWDPKASLDALAAMWRDWTGTGVPFAFETTHTRADGTLVPVEIVGGVLHYGGRDFAIGSIRDITSRKRMEEERQAALDALHESEARLRMALGAANQGLYDLDVVTGEAKVSPEYATMLGYDPADFHETNAAWIERLHPDDREPVAAVYRDYIAGRVAEYRVEFRQRTRSGDWKWILSLGRVVERDRSGQPRRMLGTHTDITDRKQAELRLEREASRRRILFEQATDGIVVVDGRCAVVEANASFARMLGYTAEEALALHAWDWDTRCPTPEGALAVFAASLTAPGRVELPLRRKDGTTIDAEISYTPTAWAGERLLFYVCRDITERRRSEDERAKLQAQLVHAQKMESVGRLAGGVAHDFNNMLSVILGYAELALGSVAPGEQIAQQLREIQQAATRSSDLTRQLLAFSRRQTVAPRVLDLNDAVSGALKMVRRLIGEDIDLEWRPGGGLWMVSMDPSQVDQILLNLAVNSRDAIIGVGRISIRTENVTVTGHGADPVGLATGEYVRLSIEDDGTGMEAQVLEHLFEPFYTTKEVGKGTGLGLATVYGIVTQNDGFIDVISAPERGATFRLYFPRVVVPQSAPREFGIFTTPASLEGRGRTVLLVEDEAAILRLGKAILEQLGYTVLATEVPVEAIRLGREHPGQIDLLITDVVMPGMNGLDLAEQLRSIRPELRCMFISGYTDDVVAHRGVLRDGVHLLQKPFTRAGLAAKVREMLLAPNDDIFSGR